MSDRIILFAHIGRTGGDTLNRVLDRYYPRSENLHFNEAYLAWKQLRSLSSEQCRKLRCLRGHGIYYGIDRYLPCPATYISIFREPVDRVISQYYVYKNDQSNPMHKQIAEGNISLAQYQKSCPNEHAKYILGFPHTRMNYPSVSDVDEAKRIIDEHFLFVGLKEFYNESNFLLQKKLGWLYPVYPLMSRVAPKEQDRSEDTPELREEIRKNNELDCLLYDYVKEKLHSELSSLSAKEKAELVFFSKSTVEYRELENALDPNEGLSREAAARLLIKEDPLILIVSAVAEVLTDFQKYVDIVNESFNRSITLEMFHDFTGTGTHPDGARLKDADAVFVFSQPGQDHIPLHLLRDLGCDEHKIVFALNPPPV